jgi:hypothetical protein
MIALFCRLFTVEWAKCEYHENVNKNRYLSYVMQLVLLRSSEDSNDSVGEISGAGFASQIARDGLALADGLQHCVLDARCVRVHAEVAQHHDGTQEQCRGICLVFSF